MIETVVLVQGDLVRLFLLTFLSFVIAMSLTPIWADLLYDFKLWKKPRQEAATGEKAKIYLQLHRAKHRNIPTMAGVLIWFSVLIVTLLFNFSRIQTYLPLFTLVSFGLLGMIDDLINVSGNKKVGGLGNLGKQFWLLTLGGLGSWWFYQKLGFGRDIGIHIPGMGDYAIGLFYIPLFIFVIWFMANAVNVTDGLDGLAGGLLAVAFGAYSLIALTQGRVGLSVFCGSVVGATLAYTWFNIHPARFFMGDTGSLALGASLGVVAMLTNTLAVLPIIGLVFVVEFLSSLIQIGSKKFFGRKVFLVAPLHHHFEALSWPETKVTMRFWVIGSVMAVVGLGIALFGRGGL